MDRSIILPAPYFEREAVGVAFRGLVGQHAGNDSALRAAVLARLKELHASACENARRQLELDGNGRRCAEGLSLFQDEIIRLIYNFATRHIYRAGNPSSGEQMAIVATGGYGRGMLAPGSDIDLLFLQPYKLTAWSESVIEYILYLLWDMGLKVGHATRSVGQCVKLARADLTIRSALLDSRLLLGVEELFDEFRQRYREDVVKGTGRAFVEEKLSERAERLERTGNSRYVVEPNVKDGKGGLRDLHTLHWLVKYLHDAEPGDEAVIAGIFSSEEAQTYRKCEDFLWTVRCHLHFLTGRAEERLAFELQPAMAERLGYTEHAGLRAVERFMKHYFLVAKDVGDLTRIVCSALEVKQLKSSPVIDRLLAPLDWRRRAKLRRTSDFRIDNGRINVADRGVFERDPVNLIRLFASAERHGVPFHPDALRLVRGSLRLIDDKLRADPAANRIFLDLLTAKASAERVLRKMNEADVLGRFLPEFGRIVAMMQFNMYHHYTVDEHLIRSVGILSEIERGLLEEDHPLSTEIFPGLKSRRALYVATLLHDVAKGRDEDHSIAGARVAREVCPRLGLDEKETETVAWLIEQHLVMNSFAQRRDLNDPKTIRDFAAIVQSHERLRMLIILTVADVRAVGPGVWNGWKGELLRTLYYETEPLLTAGHTVTPRGERIARAQAALGKALSGPDSADEWSGETVAALIERHYPAYWLRTDLETQIKHARLIERAEAGGEVVATAFSSDAFTELTELTVLAPNHPSLLALMAGACSAAGADIMGAQIYTTRDGMALDTFLIRRSFERQEDEERRAASIVKSIRRLLTGEVYLDQLLARKRAAAAVRPSAFTVPPDLIVDNSVSNRFTILEARGLDRPGLLYELTNAISELNLDINSAHIATYGEKVVDVFYVTDLTGNKITAKGRQSAVRERLEAVLGAVGDEADAGAGAG